MSGITNTQGLVAVEINTGQVFTGGSIVDSTINNTPIGGVTPSTGSFTTLSANAINLSGDLSLGRITASAATITAAVTANSLHVNTIVSAAGDVNAGANLIVGPRTVIVSGDSGQITTALLSVTGAVSAASLNVTGDVLAATGKVTASAANFTGIVSAAALKPTSTSGVIGTTTNDNAAAGSVGEYISSTVLAGAQIDLTNNATSNVTFVALTPGDWDVNGNVAYQGDGASQGTNFNAAINTTSASLPTRPGAGGYNQLFGPTVGSGAPLILPVGPMRISTATSVNAYLVVNCGFTIASAHAYGFIGARRVR